MKSVSTEGYPTESLRLVAVGMGVFYRRRNEHPALPGSVSGPLTAVTLARSRWEERS